jgi:hypothetical protein
MTKFSWIHFSDLHRGMSEQRHLWPNIEEQIFDDLARMHSISGPWHILFFTGDLVQAGSTDEFRLVGATLTRLYEHLNKLGSDPIFVPIPGNHDLKRPKGSQELKRLLSYTSDESVRTEFWSQSTSSGRGIVKRAFAPYRTWIKTLPFPHGSNSRSGLLPGDVAGTMEIDGIRVGYVGLNSTYLQLAGGDLKGKLAIELDQIIALCGENFVDWFKGNTCNFLLTHHPPSWLSADSRATLDQDIYVPGRILAHLCGHLHDGVQLNLSLGGAVPKQIFQSAALFGLEHFGEPGALKERRHGYSIGQIELSGSKDALLTLWPRVAARHQAGHWHFVADPTASLDSKDSIKFDRVHVNHRREAQKKKAKTFSVSLFATDHDLKDARDAIKDHLTKSLGVVVEDSATAGASDVSILIQGWWWDKGTKAEMWQKSKARHKLAFLIDANSEWPPRRLAEFTAETQISSLRDELSQVASIFEEPVDLPELVAKSVTELMQNTFGGQIGLAEWERSYLEFRLPAWRTGRTAKGRPHLFDAEEAEQLYQPELYVEMDGVCRGWTSSESGYPERRPDLKGRKVAHFDKSPRVTLSRWIGIEDLPRIALIGAPGGGKTIFLTRIAAVLAGACLGRPIAIDQGVNLDRLRRDFGLPIPIVIEATKIAGAPTLDARSLIANMMEEIGSGGMRPLAEDDVEQGFRTGRYLLLIDALDEIADSFKRSQVLSMLKGIAGVYPEARFLLTTRSARYTGDLRFGPELQTVEIAPLSPGQADTLCANWTIQHHEDSEYRNSLIEAAKGLTGIVSSTPDDQGLTENPLMLTAICMVFERYRSLPDDRGRLSELLVDDLCRSRRSEDGNRGWKLDENGKKGLLQRIAHSMQEEGAQSWPIEKAINVARQQVPTGEKDPNLLAAKYVDWAADHTGILRFQEVQNNAEQVRFWHRLFREHLAATGIAQVDSKASEKIDDLWHRGRLCDPFWEDVIRLLPRALGTIEKANSVLHQLETLADRDSEHRGRLYGLAMAGIIENRDLFPEVAFAEMAVRMASVYDQEGVKWPQKDRVLFLESLGRLDPVGGDPREFESWIQVPGPGSAARRPGESSVASISGELPDLRSSISKYPVTVQEFKRFVTASDFLDPALWEQMPPRVARVREELKGRIRPQLSHPNWPVVNIGVGEAIAFCRWKTRQRTDGKVVRLPLSSEWMSLLRAAGKRRWPLEGASGDEVSANTLELGFMRPTPVGAFPPQVGEIVDALGNVWEWCLLTHATAKRFDLPLRSFSVFGGSFMITIPRLREEELFIKAPAPYEYSGQSSIGFRCVLAAIPLDLSSVSFSRSDEELVRTRRRR